MTAYTFVYVTCPDRASAEAVARAAVEGRLAACANILPGHRSFYWWEGRLNEAEEVAVILKTREALFAALEARIRAVHPYECPCIVGLPIGQGHGPYLDWIGAETLPP
jgi:periplasmic divalent cation tolerance protein